jgi:cell division protein FtsZ
VVTKPFTFEGSKRRQIAEDAAADLEANVDALITIPNDRVSDVVARDASILDAFRAVDDVLRHSVQGIIDVVSTPGLINLDFADVRAVMADAGPALMGLGRAAGEDRAVAAARQAIASPLLEVDIAGARGILLSIVGSSSLRLGEVRAAAEEIRAVADPDANLIFGAGFDDALGDEVRITLIATGLAGKRKPLGVPVESRESFPATSHLRPRSSPVAAVAEPSVDIAAGAPSAASLGSAAGGAPVRPRPSVSSAGPRIPAQAHAPAEGHVSERPLRGRGSLGQDTQPAGTSTNEKGAEEPSAEDLEVPSFIRRRRARSTNEG